MKVKGENRVELTKDELKLFAWLASDFLTQNVLNIKDEKVNAIRNIHNGIIDVKYRMKKIRGD